MKIVFASNFMNHHQLYLCQALVQRCDSFCFIATTATPADRLKLGYADLNDQCDFVIPAYKSSENAAEAERRIKEADVLIIGSAPERYIRIAGKKKLILRYSERPYKDYTKLKAFISEIIHHYRYIPYRNIYMLCASAYTAVDHYQFGMYKHKCFKWGYFPKVEELDIDEVMKNKASATGKTELLWVGRFIDWKHPELAVEAAEALRASGFNFQLEMIGTGEMEPGIRRMIEEKGLGNCVQMLGAMPPEQVRVNMERADILLFTSDRNEGWGAVMNEAMNSGCAILADKMIGSAPFLIEDGVNGLTYRTGDREGYIASIVKLVEDSALRQSMGKTAYMTLLGQWSPECAAERLVKLIEVIQNGEDTPFDEGPCSRAELIPDIVS